ncbi:LmeA family phospholipid-binding protein [Streptomyces sp. Tue6028]|uniref:LmeA family phospholipid-binding protein n=1 Tax=Streptomyces sp. Tue6028 TaxID=2036037 RepID=UPI003D75798E
MRTPHHIDTHRSGRSPASGEHRVPSDGTPPPEVPLGRNPYDELAALADPPHDGPRTARDRAEGEPSDDEEPWSPPNHRRGSRRRNRATGLPTVFKCAVWLLTVTCLVTLADRWAALYAEHKASQKLKDQLDLAAAPEVRIGGFPFLTQLAAQRLDSVSVTVPDVAARRVTLTRITATARDVRIDGDGPTSIRGALVRQLRGRVQLSFADMNRELGASQVSFSSNGADRVLARGALPVAGHDLRVRADAHIRREGDRGIALSVDGMRLDIGHLATYRPGTRASEGLHLTPASARLLTREGEKIRAFLSVPAIVHRLGVPDSVVRAALRDDDKLHRLTGTPRFVHDLMSLNLVDVALAHPGLLKRVGLDPSLLTALTRLTRPQIADRFSFSFQLPKPRSGDVRLLDVAVEKDGIRADVTGTGLLVGH